MLQLADGGVHARLQDGSSGRIPVAAQLDGGVLGCQRVVEVQDVVLRPPRRVGIEGNNAVEGARPVQGQGGEGRSSVGDAVYRQHGFRSVSIQIGDGGRAGSGKIQGGGSRDSAHFIGGSTPAATLTCVPLKATSAA